MQTRATESNSDFRARKNTDYSGVLSAHSPAFDDGDNSSGDVESLVYYFSIQIDPMPLTRKRYHSFGKDLLRCRMILKFMKFYSWCPNLPGTIDKERREQLRKHLKLEESKSSSRLSAFMSNKFSVLTKRGWVSGDSSNIPVKYHECTDHWLEHTWDGHIEHGRKYVNRKKRSLEHTAIAPPPQRQKLTGPVTHTLSDGETRAAVNPESRIETMSPQGTQRSISSRAADSHEPIEKARADGLPSDDFIDNIIDLTADDSTDAIQSQNLMSNRSQIRSSMPSLAEPFKANKKESRDAWYEAHEFFALIDGLSESDMPESTGGTAASGVFGEIITVQDTQTPASANGGFTSQDSTLSAHTAQADSITAQAPQEPESLVGRERSCIAEYNSISTGLMNVEAKLDLISHDQDRLREEIEIVYTGNRKADEKLNGPLSPTLDPDVIEIRRKQASQDWNESIERACDELLLAKKKIEEEKTSLQAQLSAKSVELKSLRATNKKEKALYDGRMTGMASIMEKLGNGRSNMDSESLTTAEYGMDGDEEYGKW